MLDKARAAYGASIDTDLAKAIDDLRERPQRLDACVAALRMTGLSKAQVRARVKALAPR